MTALRRTAGVALVLTFAVILLGAWVRATNSGLSCPDWPTCYGHWVPLPGEIPADAGYSYFQVMLEWVHRLLAGVVLGPLVLVIGLLAWRRRRARPRLPLYAAALVLLLLIQASLGGVTVLDQNSPWSVALHLGTALVLFGVLWLIFARSGAPAPGVPGARVLALLSWLLALGAMVSAAMMTKSGAALACAEWPLCGGELSDPLVRLHLAHRLLAAATALAILALFVRLRSTPALARLAHALLALIVVEIVLGGVVVLLAVPLWAGLVHQATGVLTFGLLSLLMWRTLAPAARAHGEPAHVGGLSRA